MTYKKLIHILAKYNIPINARLMSDSSWECNATDMDGVYYNKKENTIVFTQDFSKYETDYIKENGWEKLLWNIEKNQ